MRDPRTLDVQSPAKDAEMTTSSERATHKVPGRLEQLTESMLLSSRYMVWSAVIAAILASLTLFFFATVDIGSVLKDAPGYMDFGLSQQARAKLHDTAVSKIVDAVDGFLVATFMLIFGLGVYEL